MVKLLYSSLLVLVLVGLAAAQFRFTTSNTTCSRFVQWNRLALLPNATIPSRRFDMAVAVDPRTNNLFVTGGTSDAFELSSDMLKFNPENVEWTETTTDNTPGLISDHTATFINGSLWIWGGKSDTGLRNSLFIYDIDANTWTNPDTTNTPLPRYGHSAVLFNNTLFIFGGLINDTHSNELWSLNLSTLEWTQHNSTETPLPRLWHSTVLINNKWILYGGYNGVRGMADIWSLDFATLQWTQISPTSPLDPRSGQVAFALEGLMFVVGGEYDDPNGLILNNNDVWSFNPATTEWTQWCSVGTSIHPRLGARGDTATLGGVTGGLIFGGLTTDVTFTDIYAYNDVWAMNLVPQNGPVDGPVSVPASQPSTSTPTAPTAAPHGCPTNDAASLTLTGVTSLVIAAALF